MNRAWGRALGTVLLTILPAAGVPSAWADPADPVDPADPAVAGAVAPGPAAPGPMSAPAGGDNPVAEACNQFNAALNLAAANYEDFAYATAGNGNTVDYQDPTVSRSNIVGRTALREAAAVALSASRTPGLPPDVSDPMQSWSLHATKLVLIMGLRGGGDSLNNAATQLNTDASNAQMACALNGIRR